MAENSGAENRWTRLREIVRNRRALWWTGGAVVLTALVVVILWKVPQLQVKYAQGIEAKDRFSSENEARKTLATILGGIVVLAGAYFTWRNIKLTQESVATAQKSLMISQEGQITDRFTKAIEQLGAVNDKSEKKLEVRLGGIYALERIANESERDHWPIMEVLCTYVRENAPLAQQESLQKNEAPVKRPYPTADILAILTVVARRDREFEHTTQRLDLHQIGAQEADLREAYLSRADLTGADLSGAFLGDANLSGAQLGGADLSGAVLCGAVLSGAHLSGADLSRANLSGADLSGADLIEANLWGADLRQTKGLTQEQVGLAKGDNFTQLPENLHMPDKWGKR